MAFGDPAILEGRSVLVPDLPAGLALVPYRADLQFTRLVRGTDNVRYDVFLSLRFVEATRRFILDLVRQAANVARFFSELKSNRPLETSAFKKMLTALLQASLTQAKYEKNIELDLLARVAILKLFTQEISSQFSHLMLECKECLRARGTFFERTEQAHQKKVYLAETQANRRNIYRKVGQTLRQLLVEVDEALLRRSRRALFGDDFEPLYAMLRCPLVFVEGGRDDYLYLEQYILLGNYLKDEDRMERFDALLKDLLRELLHQDAGNDPLEQARTRLAALSAEARALQAEAARLDAERQHALRQQERSEAFVARLIHRGRHNARAQLVQIEQQQQELTQRLQALEAQLRAAQQEVDLLEEACESQLGEYLCEPENARRLFDPDWAEKNGADAALRTRLREAWLRRLEESNLLGHVLASYALRDLHQDYCPPVHLQQLKKALVDREELKRVSELLHQFPTRQVSLARIEEAARALRRSTPEQLRVVVVRFAEDLMRLRRDLRNYHRLVNLMESVHLVADERTRELSRMNQTLYEFLLPEEDRPTEDRTTSHVVIKVDVRDSTRITQELLARGLNPASHFSRHLYEPVRRLLDRYSATKVFIEGDAIILAIYETETNRAQQRAVAKACLLSRHILEVVRANNRRAEAAGLPPLTLGLGIAFQNSAPTLWMEGDSRIMISQALNRSDRLSSSSKVARRILVRNPSPFQLFHFQTIKVRVEGEEAEEFLIRWNVNGIELNREGFEKLSEEVALISFTLKVPMPWGTEPVTLYAGQVPVGEAFEVVVVRKGVVRCLSPTGRVAEPGTLEYFEVCTHPRILQLAASRLGVTAPQTQSV
ncbi:MAG: hypothetical protein K6U02_04955 [Firmicutes bacterium]|nr:hypothetical protein [Bacillota bacterium]